MLQVFTPDEVYSLIRTRFRPLGRTEYVSLNDAAGRILSRDIRAEEFVPDFDRSTVDGYAVHASDTFGCTDAIPAILRLDGSVEMGQAAPSSLEKGCCFYVPTGGAVPDGADCMVMVEYTEDYGDGTVGILKPGAPGMNLIFRGDDVSPGMVLYEAGQRLSSKDIGALAALGVAEVPVSEPLRVAVISTGDELVPPDQSPTAGQVRDVNTPMISAMLKQAGVIPVPLGIIRDDANLLLRTVSDALKAFDVVIISGGSSVGMKDATCRIMESVGEVLLHGIAVKPGKPTILGVSAGKPIVGLPGHPAAAWFVMKLFVFPLLAQLNGERKRVFSVQARLTENVSANHGRAQITPCRLNMLGEDLAAEPIRSKSGLITQLSKADGFFCIPRDSEGLEKGAEVSVFLCED